MTQEQSFEITESIPGGAGSFFTRYATFRGRARRAEFFYVNLTALILIALTAFPVGFAAGFLASYLGIQAGAEKYVTWLISSVFLIPIISASVRRLHDIGASGWWTILLAVPFLNWAFFLFLLFKKGKP